MWSESFNVFLRSDQLREQGQEVGLGDQGRGREHRVLGEEQGWHGFIHLDFIHPDLSG